MLARLEPDLLKCSLGKAWHTHLQGEEDALDLKCQEKETQPFSTL